MTSEICESVTVPSKQSTTTLIDIRDNKRYTVAKLLDGKCWMTQNLRIANTSINSTNSDIVSGSFSIPSSGTSGSGYAHQAVYIDTNCGGYYSGFTANAGKLFYQSGGNTNSNHESICPKGWHMPSSCATFPKDFYEKTTVLATPPSFNLCGYYDFTTKIIGSQNELGKWWTTSGGGSSAYGHSCVIDSNDSLFHTKSEQLSYNSGNENVAQIRCYSY